MKNKEKLKKVNLLLNEMKVFVAYLEDIHKDLETRKSESESCDRPWGAIKNRAKSFRNSLLEFYR